MRLTKEEIEIMKDNLRQIEKYVKDNYRPLLEPLEQLSVRFGANNKYSFGFNDVNIWVYCGGDTCYFHHMPGSGGVYEQPSESVPLIIEWASVKKNIQCALDARAEKKRAIREFVV